MTKVEEAMEEIAAEIAVFEPEAEGLDDDLRLNIEDATRVDVAALRVEYTERLALLHAAHTALTNLMLDGHPGMPDREVSEAVSEDLAEQEATIIAARKKFKTRAEASGFTFTAGAVEPK